MVPSMDLWSKREKLSSIFDLRRGYPPSPKRGVSVCLSSILRIALHHARNAHLASQASLTYLKSHCMFEECCRCHVLSQEARDELIGGSLVPVITRRVRDCGRRKENVRRASISRKHKATSSMH